MGGFSRPRESSSELCSRGMDNARNIQASYELIMENARQIKTLVERMDRFASCYEEMDERVRNLERHDSGEDAVNVVKWKALGLCGAAIGLVSFIYEIIAALT